jgi:hypothetical protein
MNYNPPIERCAHCIMPASPGHIELDGKGVCNLCAKHQDAVATSADFLVLSDEHKLQLLQTKVAKLKGGNGAYDCAVSISGGKDSVMTLYIAKELLGLNPLAVMINNGFALPGMFENVQNATDILGVDLVIFKTCDLLELFPYFIRSKKRIYYCRACHALIDLAVRDICQRFGIRLILGGYTKGQQYIRNFELFWIYDESDKNTIELVRKHPKFAHLTELYENQGKFFAKHYPNIVQLSPFKYIKWDEDEIIETLSQKLGFKLPEGSWPDKSSNCSFNFVAQYLALQQFGYAQHESELSYLVRAGETTRERALKVIESPILDTDMMLPLKKLGLTLDDVTG